MSRFKQFKKLPFILLSIFGVSSCNSYKNLRKGESAISFHSVFENDTLNVKVNDSIRFHNHKIEMVYEWGISKNSTIYVAGKEFSISGTYKTTKIIESDFGVKFNRTLKFDTILKAKNGRYIDISANDEKIIVEQSKKIRIVD